jgi:hypothetical protein
MTDKSMGPYNSWGNGSAMRVAAVGWSAGSIEEALAAAANTAMPTHNHEEGVKGAQAVAMAVFMARTGSSRNEIRRSVSDATGYRLSRSIDTIRNEYEFEISCQKSVPEAIVAFLDSADFEDAIRNAVSLGGDSDTQAAIAGSIAEAFYGIPRRFLAMILPRLPLDILEVCRNFAEAYRNEEVVSPIADEISMRTGSEPEGMRPYPDRYSILMHAETNRKLKEYTAGLRDNTTTPGHYLKREIDNGFAHILNPDVVLQLLLRSKKPRIFAESELKGDGSDWNRQELSILGDIAVAVPVDIFDDGRHNSPNVHGSPFGGTLLFVPGALLAGGTGTLPADWSEVVSGNKIDEQAYDSLYMRRLLPVLKFASADALRRGKKALITVPGLGCGMFAGQFRGLLQERLAKSLERILSSCHREIPGVRMVWYDPYQGCKGFEATLGHIEYRVRPLTEGGKPQLCRPVDYQEAEENLSDCRLYSIVAWDHVSWPGNDYYDGARSTDDGVKAAATDSMFRITGIRGRYDQQRNMYLPPEGYRTWGEVVADNDLPVQVFRRPVIVNGPSETEKK